MTAPRSDPARRRPAARRLPEEVAGPPPPPRGEAPPEEVAGPRVSPGDEVPTGEVAVPPLPPGGEALAEEVAVLAAPGGEALAEDVAVLAAPGGEALTEEVAVLAAPRDEAPAEEVAVLPLPPAEEPPEEVAGPPLPPAEEPPEEVAGPPLPPAEEPPEEVAGPPLPPTEEPPEEVAVLPPPSAEEPPEEVAGPPLPPAEKPPEEVAGPPLPPTEAPPEEVGGPPLPPAEELPEEVAGLPLPPTEAPPEEVAGPPLPPTEVPPEEVAGPPLPPAEEPPEEVAGPPLPPAEAPPEEVAGLPLPPPEEPPEEVADPPLPPAKAPPEEVAGPPLPPAEEPPEEVAGPPLPPAEEPAEEVAGVPPPGAEEGDEDEGDEDEGDEDEGDEGEEAAEAEEAAEGGEEEAEGDEDEDEVDEGEEVAEVEEAAEGGEEEAEGDEDEGEEDEDEGDEGEEVAEVEEAAEGGEEEAEGDEDEGEEDEDEGDESEEAAEAEEAAEGGEDEGEEGGPPLPRRLRETDTEELSEEAGPPAPTGDGGEDEEAAEGGEEEAEGDEDEGEEDEDEGDEGEEVAEGGEAAEGGPPLPPRLRATDTEETPEEVAGLPPASAEAGAEDAGAQGGPRGNRGHGNDTDGVDDDNPGKGGGGPNALKDPDAEVDESEGARGNQGDETPGATTSREGEEVAEAGEAAEGGPRLPPLRATDTEETPEEVAGLPPAGADEGAEDVAAREGPRGNRGHGNDTDGVDDDNPGKGDGGPNAGKDPDADVDESEGARGNQGDDTPGAEPSQEGDEVAEREEGEAALEEVVAELEEEELADQEAEARRGAEGGSEEIQALAEIEIAPDTGTGGPRGRRTGPGDQRPDESLLETGDDDDDDDDDDGDDVAEAEEAAEGGEEGEAALEEVVADLEEEELADQDVEARSGAEGGSEEIQALAAIEFTPDTDTGGPRGSRTGPRDQLPGEGLLEDEGLEGLSGDDDDDDDGDNRITESQQAALPSGGGAASGAGGSAQQVVVPDWARDSGTFSRSGSDLIIEAPDGTQVVISGYFDAGTVPVLMTAAGDVVAVPDEATFSGTQVAEADADTQTDETGEETVGGDIPIELAGGEPSTGADQGAQPTGPTEGPGPAPEAGPGEPVIFEPVVVPVIPIPGPPPPLTLPGAPPTSPPPSPPPGDTTDDDTPTPTATDEGDEGPVNTQPTASDVPKTGTEDLTLTFAAADFINKFTDADGNQLAKIKITSLPANGTLKLSGVDVTAGQEIPESAGWGNLTFVPTATFNGSTSFTWQGFDGTVFSADASVNINITAVNDAPVLDNSQSPALTAINEDDTTSAGTTVAAIVVNGSITDVDGTAVEAIAITALDEANGTWQAKVGGAGFAAIGAVAANTAFLMDSTDLVRFVPNANFNGSATITFRAWDKTTGAAGNKVDASTSGGATAFSTATDTASITINAVNDAPTVSSLAGDTADFVRNGSAVVIDQGTAAAVADVDSTDFNGGNLTVSITANGVGTEDALAINNQGTGAGQIGVSGSNVTFAGTTIGTFAGGTSGNNLVVTFNSASATPAAATALVKNITYQNTNTTTPTKTARTVRFTLDDGDGGTSTSANTDVTVKISERSVNVQSSVLQFDGSNDFVNLGSPADFAFGSGTFTMEAWIRTTVTDNTRMDIVSLGKTGVNDRGAFLFVENGKLAFDTFGSVDVISTAAVNDQAWHHVAVTRSGTTIKFYIDGDLAATNNQTVTLTVTQGASTIGGETVGAKYFNGQMDDVRIWSTARTATEIKANYNQQLAGTETGLKAYYRFDDDHTKTDVADLTSNNNDGVLTDGTLAGPLGFVRTLGKAMQFDGVNDSITVGRGAGDNLAIAGDLTMESWVNFDGQSNIAGFAGASIENAADNVLYMMFAFANGDLTYAHENGTGVNNTLTFSGVLTLGKWQHVAAVRDVSAKSVTMYVNGVSVGTKTYANGPDGSSSGQLTIGKLPGFNTNFTDGELSDLRIWSTARSATEIADNYNQTLFGSQTGLVSNWHLDEIVSGTVIDYNHRVQQRHRQRRHHRRYRARRPRRYRDHHQRRGGVGRDDVQRHHRHGDLQRLGRHGCQRHFHQGHHQRHGQH